MNQEELCGPGFFWKESRKTRLQITGGEEVLWTAHQVGPEAVQ